MYTMSSSFGACANDRRETIAQVHAYLYKRERVHILLHTCCVCVRVCLCLSDKVRMLALLLLLQRTQRAYAARKLIRLCTQSRVLVSTSAPHCDCRTNMRMHSKYAHTHARAKINAAIDLHKTCDCVQCVCEAAVRSIGHRTTLGLDCGCRRANPRLIM